ncbi:MAG: glycosyltransferase [Actinomycetota bacterium]
MSARILRAITRLNIGGPARQALLLTRDLRPEFDTVLVTGRPPTEEGELSDPRVEPVRIPLARPIRPGADLRSLGRLRGLVASVRPHIVHTHMAKAGALARAAALTVRPRPRLVHTYHGHVLEGYFSAPVERAFIAVERALARRTDILIAVSDEVRDALLELGVGRPEQYRVIQLGFDLSDLLEVTEPDGAFRASVGVPPGAPLVAVLGRLAPIKDHSTLLRAVARLPDVHLVVLGDGELRSELKAEAEGLGLSARVRFLGWVTDVVSVMRDVDAVALSSRNEGTPVSLIEALAAARPVVSTDVGGVRAVVTDGTSALLVPAGDPVALAQALDRLVRASPAERRGMGEAGRAHVRERFDARRLVADIRDLYASLLA